MPLSPFVALLALTLSPPAAHATPHPPAAPSAGAHTAASAGTPAPHRTPHIESADLYSLRARRRFASYLRLRLLELRKAGLDRAADAVERRLPVETLFERP
jgi:hypothetical protein